MISHIFLIFAAIFLETEAYEVCNFLEEDDQFVCYDTSSSIGFCCNYYDLDYHSCCHADIVWGLWYFWIGIVFGLIFVASVIGVFCRSCKKASSPRRSTQVATITQETIPVSDIDRSVQIKLESAPPSYDHTMMQTMPVTGQTYPAGPAMPQPQHSTFQQQPYYQPPSMLLYENAPPVAPSHQT